MKKIIFVATSVVAGSALAFYFMRNKKVPTMHVEEAKKRTHHKTNVFANAKA